MADATGDAGGGLATAAAAIETGSSDGVIPMDQYLELFRRLSHFLRSLGSVRAHVECMRRVTDVILYIV